MTDHKEEAEYRASRVTDAYNLGVLPADTVIALAQVSATLYLAEQQRIANIIALVQDAEMVDPVKGHWEEGFWEDARKVIVEGLGIA